MAEAFPENPEDLNKLENPISVLILATKWQFDTYGLSTVNKSLVNNLRIVDPEGKKIKITCAVVEEEKNIKDDQRADAEKYKVELRMGKPPRGAKKEPNLEWLDQNIAAYYPDLLRKNSYDFVIGHAPYLANGCLNLRDMYNATESRPKIMLMIHDLPKTIDGDTDEESLHDWLCEADVIFSVGKSVESEIISSIKSLDHGKKPIHKLYVPGFPVELFNVHRTKVNGNKVQGTQHVTVMTGEQKDLEINGLDFPLAVLSTAAASAHIWDFHTVKTNFVLLTDNKDEKEKWKKEFGEILESGDTRRRKLYFQVDSPENIEKMKVHARKSNLMILPLKPGSPIFGTESLSAIAAGVPILVSNQSGIASLLETIYQVESILRESTLDSDTETWKEGILQKLLRPEDSQRKADRMREQLLLDTSIAQTHLDFIRTVVETSRVDLTVELNSDSVVSQEHIDIAVKFGVDLGDLTDPIETQKYVVAFIHKLLLQREKLDRKQLTDYLQSNIATLWKEVLSTLETSDRKLLAVESGSIIFTLFCPTIRARRELRDESWIKDVTSKMESLVKKIGVESQLMIRPPEEPVVLRETDLMSKIRRKMRHVTGHSEGYGTMTTLRSSQSDLASEIPENESKKVMEWLEQQHDASGQPETADTSRLTLQKTTEVNHIGLGRASSSLYTKFTISGSIGIASPQAKPTLSVIYPTSDEITLTLSSDIQYTSALFTTISGQEYLAAASRDGIRLWNLAANTSTVVYKFEESGLRRLCAVDERTVACGEEQPSPDGFSKIYILNTDTEKFTLSGTLRVKANQQSTEQFGPSSPTTSPTSSPTGEKASQQIAEKSGPSSPTKLKPAQGITDMCYVKSTDGTPCLLLSFPFNSLIKCVEMVGGKVRWQVDKQQMVEPGEQKLGASFHPWSICTDGSTVFVANAGKAKLHLLSVEDGTVVASLGLNPFGIIYLGCVRLHGEHLYVGHLNKDLNKYYISKFAKPV